jgi:hypothetical protein
MELNLDPTWRFGDAASLIIWSPALHKAQAEDTQSAQVINGNASRRIQAYNTENNH